MPTVPRLDSPQVQQSNIPTVRVNQNAPLAAFGGGEAAQNVMQAAGNIGKAAFDLEIKERRKANDVATTEAFQMLVRAENDLQYNPETGFMTKRGKDSFNILNDYGTQFDKTADEIEKGLGNDEQRQMFREIRTKRRTDFESGMQRHIFGESKAFDEQTTKAALETNREDAILNYQDPQRLATAFQLQDAMIMDHADRQGWSPETTKANLLEAKSKTHQAVIARMLSAGNDVLAKEYFEKNKVDILGSDATAVEKDLQEGVLRGESQRESDAIIFKNRSRSSALAEAYKIEEPKKRDEVVRRVNQYFSDMKQAENEARNDTYMAAANMLEGAPGRDPRDVIPAPMWTKLTPEQRNSLANRAGDPPNDNKAWLDFLELSPKEVSTLSRADFESKYWSKFDREHRTRAESQWEASRGGNGKSGQTQLSTTLTFKDRIDNVARSSGIVDSKRTRAKFTRDEIEAYSQFENKAAQEIERYELNTLGGKRKATGEEVQKILDDLAVKKVFIEKSWARDPEKPTFMLTEDERGSAYVPVDKVPTSDRNAIENALRKQNKRVTDDKIQRAYAAYLMGDRNLFNSILGE